MVGEVKLKHQVRKVSQVEKVVVVVVVVEHSLLAKKKLQAQLEMVEVVEGHCKLQV